MASSRNYNDERRSLFLSNAQANNINTSVIFAHSPNQSRFLPLNANEESMNNFTQKIQQYVTENGTKNFDQWAKRMLDEGCKEPLLIAVTGATRVGKSTFINTMRGLLPTDPEAAKTSSLAECTMKPKAYPDPKNLHLIYYDLPGIGTANFPRNEYTKKIPLDHYDFFIILSRDCFTENDCYLAKELDRLEKKFYFVRTRIDENIRNEREEIEGCFDELDYVDETRQVTQQSVNQLPGLRRVFIISGSLKNYAKWDFPELVQTLVKDAAGIKQATIIRTVTANSREVVDRKAALLEERIFLVAVVAAGAAAIPIPFLSIACDVPLISREIDRYMKDFGLDPESMESLARTLDIGQTGLEKKIFGASDVLKSNNMIAITSLIMTTLGKTALARTASEYIQVVPILGQFISSATSFFTIKSTLQFLLNEIKLLALKRVDQLIAHTK